MGEREEYDGGPVPGRDLDVERAAEAEWAGYDAWLDAEVAAGRDPDRAPDERDDTWEPEDLAPGSAVRPRFGPGDEADALSPGPLLAALTESALQDLGQMPDDELIGVLQASGRQVAREQYKQVLVTAEFGRRRQAAFEAARDRGVPEGIRPGGFPGEELACELLITRVEAGHRIDDAVDLTSRLPRTLAAMAAGQVDADRAGWITFYTRGLSDIDTAQADELLAAAAPGLRVDQLARKAAALEMKLNPEAVKARRERTRRENQRVEARREASGNASLAGREMGAADVMASKAHIDSLAARLRAGRVPGPLGALRVMVMADLTQGRDPLDRLSPRAAAARTGPSDPEGESSPPPGGHPPDGDAGGRTDPGAADPETWPGWGAGRDDDPEDFDRDEPGLGRDSAGRDSAGDPARGAPVPMPALINLTVPVGTLLGWSSAPAEAGAWGLLDRDETRAIAGAAARHSRTRWCVTLTAPDGTAIAHGCAHGQHSRLLDQLSDSGPAPPAQLTELLRRLSPAFTTVATGSCDHGCTEDHYTPSRKLKHLIRARSATCDAPGCQAPAAYADLDHTTPWPDGPTCQCNLAPRCRTHHRAKQAPDWKVEQPQPGVTRWTMPSGRTHTTTPTKYDS